MKKILSNISMTIIALMTAMTMTSCNSDTEMA